MGTAAEQHGNAEEPSSAFANDLAVVYLARFAEGTRPVATFVKSYLRHPAGVAHDCVVIRKGFKAGSSAQDKILAPLHAHAISVSDDGFDISAYAEVAARLPHRHVIFLNTFSEIAADNWLQKLYSACAEPTVGIAGATGSYESLRSSMKRFNKGWWLFEQRIAPGPTRLRRVIRFVRKLLPRRFGNSVATKVISYFVASAKKPHYDLSLDDKFEAFWEQEIKPGGMFEFLSSVPLFPNAHIRTNAFIIGRKAFLSALPGPIRDKKDSYLFESGPDSLTQKILRGGQKVVVVGADGRQYNIDRWAESGTFRLGDQRNLLVKDNQTRAFEGMSEGEKLAFVGMTWGEQRCSPD